MPKILWVVAGALINQHKQVLLAKRPEGKNFAGFWEFPGGKIEQNETPERALVREIKEELNITLDEMHLIPVSFASHTYDTFHLVMPLFACQKWTGIPTPLENQEIEWVSIHNLAKNKEKYKMPPADDLLLKQIVNFVTD